MSHISPLSKVTLIFCIGLLGFNSSASGQVRDADFYRFNVPSSPLLININLGKPTTRPTQSLENISHGTIVNFQTGCVRRIAGILEIGDRHTRVTIGIGSIDTRDNILYLPNNAHGYLPLQCSAPSKVAVLEVDFVDGGRWSVNRN